MTEKIDAEVVAFNKLTGKRKHFCLDWDGMAIEENCPEFEACLCFEDDPTRVMEITRVEVLRSGILTVDGQRIELVLEKDKDRPFRDVFNTQRYCVADPAGVLTEWTWEEGSPKEYRTKRHIDTPPGTAL